MNYTYSLTKTSPTQVLASELINQENLTMLTYKDHEKGLLQARLGIEIISKIEFVNNEIEITYSKIDTFDNIKMKFGICEIPYIETDLSKIKEFINQYNSQNFKIQ